MNIPWKDKEPEYPLTCKKDIWQNDSVGKNHAPEDISNISMNTDQKKKLFM